MFVVFRSACKDPVMLKVSFLDAYSGLEVGLEGYNLHGSVIVCLCKGGVGVLTNLGKVLFKCCLGGGK